MPEKILSVTEALRNPRRRLIVSYLIERLEVPFSKLARELNMSAGTLYNHLAILLRVGLINMYRKRGRVFVRINEELLINKRVNKCVSSV
ncbi:MAG: hypothetical protein DRN04_00480 [Thermoprotei archaeon]|nr:MAG: hypothetical protein DRN04_00480 [Thermoprotei archaeon]